MTDDYSNTQLLDIPASSSNLTMSSLEISELTGKLHKNVIADIRNMLKALSIQPAEFSARYIDAQGKSRECFNLPKRESLILVSGYDINLRAKIIDRWAELEAITALPDLSTHKGTLQALKSLTEQTMTILAERDHAIATKAEIGSRREATAMATAARAQRQSELLLDELGRSHKFATIIAVKNKTGTEYDWAPLRRWCKENGRKPVKVPDKRYGEVMSWPAESWMEVYNINLADIFKLPLNTNGKVLQ